MTNSDRDIQAKFRRDAINVMSNHSEAVSMRLDRTEATVARSADSIDQLVESIKTQSHSIDRLERAVTQMVAEGQAQRETVNNLIKLATALVQQRAS